MGKSRCFDRGVSARRRRPQAVRQVRRQRGKGAAPYKLQCKRQYRLPSKWQYKIQYNLQYRVQYNIPYEFRAPLVSLPPCLWSLWSLWPPVSTSMALRGARQKFLVGQQCAPSEKKSFLWARSWFCTHFYPPTSFAGSRPRCQMRWQASRCFTISFQQKKNRQLSAP